MAPNAAARVPLSHARERLYLALILAAALVARLARYASPETPPWWFGESAVVWVARALEDGQLLQQWLRLLHTTQVSWVHESTTMMPVAIAFQRLFGPSLHLPAVVGAFWGLLTVVFAWLAGRTVRSPAFGLLFAGFVAASPLQITWARLGGLQIGAPAHVLLVVWLAYRAGLRPGIVATVLAVVAAWASLYHYYAARVALPLAVLALGLGLLRSRARLARTLLVLVVAAGTVSALVVWLAADQAREVIWPRYAGYVGSAGEQTLRDYVASIETMMSRELPRATAAYFFSGRAQVDYTPPAAPLRVALSRDPGVGGLCLLPVALLGLVGLAVACRHPLRDLVWIALAAVSFLLPLLSTTTARRFLVFDLAWCALAASAVLGLLESRPLARWTRGHALGAGLAVVLVLGVDATLTVLAMGRRLPSTYWTPIPFGESGFGDGRTCTGCMEQALGWQKEIADGAFVVLFESDLDGEGRTIPAGLPLYGKIAALAAGRPANFLEYYATMANFDIEPPRTGPLYDARRTQGLSYLVQRIDEARPSRIVWLFPEPTQWERALAERLALAGGERRDGGARPIIPGPRPANPGVVVTTPWEARTQALDVIASLEHDAGASAATPCVRSVADASSPELPLILGTRRTDVASGTGPRWVVGGWQNVRSGDRVAPAANPVAIASAEDTDRLHVLTRYGLDVIVDMESGAHFDRSIGGGTIGRDCAVRVGQDWWIVDPLSGNLAAGPHHVRAGGQVTGIARDPAGRVLLASAAQTITVLDPRTGTEIARFPARVPPSRRFHFGECTPLVAGDGWLATLDHFGPRLFMYAADGTDLGALRLDALLGLARDAVTAVQASGAYLGVATRGQRVMTLRIDTSPGCRGGALTPSPSHSG